MSTRMKAKNSVAGGQGECFITIESNRYNFMNAINVEATAEKTKVEVPILGNTGKGNKATGWKGSGSATFHYNSSIFRKLMQRYKDTGEDIYFDMQITNEDKGTDVGRQTIILKNCNFDSITLAKLDAESDDYMEEEMDFTFDDFEIPETFTMMDGMI